MAHKTNPIHQLVLAALERGEPLTLTEIKELRKKSRTTVVACKACFWIAIGVINLLIFAPSPGQINATLLYSLIAICLVLAFPVPILGIRTHNLRLDLLKISTDLPKKKLASEAGKLYIEKVREYDRSFITAEVEVLEAGH